MRLVDIFSIIAASAFASLEFYAFGMEFSGALVVGIFLCLLGFSMLNYFNHDKFWPFVFVKKTKILFVCYGNVCRSAMAEKIMNNIYGEKFIADSAGAHPALPDIDMDEPTIRVMREIGIDISKHQPKSIDSVIGSFDVVVNMSPDDNETLKYRNPNLKNAKWYFWKMLDPRGEPIEIYRAVREAIKEKIFSELFQTETGS